MNLNFKLSYILINVIFILAYIVVSSISNIPKPFILVLGLINFFVLLPNNIHIVLKQIINYNERLSCIYKCLIWLTIFFFFVIPILYISNVWLNIQLSRYNLIIFLVIVSSLLLLYLLTFGSKSFKSSSTNYFTDTKGVIGFMRDNFVLIFGLLLYLVLHWINYRFYIYIPEADGYTDLLSINKIINDGFIINRYRGFFKFSVSVVSLITGLKPYNIYTHTYIYIQATLLLVIYEFVHIFKIKSKLLHILIILIPLSIPVLNMEIDIIRPQSVLIMSLPMYVLFSYKMLSSYKQERLFYLVMSSFIVVFGLNYHQLFYILLLNHILLLIYLYWKPLYEYMRTNMNKLVIFVFLIAMLESLFITHIYSATFSRLFGSIIRGNILNIFDSNSWRIWFLNNYFTDKNAPTGWPGFWGAFKYYSYYLSPVLLFYIPMYIYTVIKKKDYFNKLFIAIITMLTIFFLYAEIFPRLGYIYLPERAWLFIDIIILLTIPYTVMKNRKLFNSKIIIIINIILIIIGITGSLYIAYNKTILTTPEEYQASIWIRENTSSDSIFITQPGNAPMLKYFADRKIVIPAHEYFLDDKVVDYSVYLKGDDIDNNKETSILQQPVRIIYDKASQNGTSIYDELAKINNELVEIKNELNVSNEDYYNEVYILYSTNKFKGLYKTREWWINKNFINANLEKFNDVYELVYNKNGIYIWKVK